LQINSPEAQRADIFPNGIRLLAILAGCLSGFAGFLVFGIVFCFVPILGAIIQPYVPCLGRWVFSIGAMLVSVYVALFVVPQAFGAITMLPDYHEPHDVAVLSLFVLSIALVVWLDVALVRNEKVKKTS
jgi:hypothetical protein